MSDDFDKDLEAALDAAEIALNNGAYKKAMRDLLALSMADIKNLVPKASYADYSKLLSVVEHASAKNVAEANLKEKITKLGKAAISIAKLIPSLAVIFA